MSRRAYLAAIDAGSSSCRVTAFSATGEPAVEFGAAYRPRLGPRGLAEQALEPIWDAVVEGLRRVAAAVPGGELAGLGVTAQLGLVLVDADGDPLGPAITWMDHRADEEAAELARRLGSSDLTASTGRRAAGELVGPKLVWLKRHEPARVARASAALSLKDYLVLRLTGARVTDPTHASYTLLFDVRERRWADALVRELDLPARFLPEVREAPAVAGTLASEIAAAVGLPAGTPVAVGGPDGTVGALGAGMVAAEMAVDVAGTSDVVFAATDRPAVDPSGRLVVNSYALPGYWAIGGPTGLTGGALAWLRDLLAAGGGDPTFETLEQEAASVPAGCDGLLAFPNLAGARSPQWLPGARGVFFGLAPEHRRGHLVRSLVESVAYQVAQLLAVADEHGVRAREVRLAGGGARGQLAAQIRADVLERPVLVPTVTEASSLGTALLAGLACGLYSSPSVAADCLVRIAHRYAPDPRVTDTYRASRAAFERLVSAVRPLFGG